MRLFFAINFNKEIKQNLFSGINNLQKICPEIKWIKKPALHLTLKFLGETSSLTKDEIINNLDKTFGEISSFNLVTTQTGFFPNARQARVFYLGLQQNQTLINCFKILENELLNLGIEKEKRSLNPHITLARIKQKIAPDAVSELLNYSFPELQISVPDFALMSSDLLSSGARYTVVQRFSLRTK